MSSSFRTAAPHAIFSELDSIARKSGLIRRRSRKFSAAGFLSALIQCATRGSSSFQHLATSQAGFEPLAMTRQGMFERLSPASSEFLVRVMNELLAGSRAKSSHPRFRRILVEDSTIISMAKSNAGHFPNNGNGKEATAGCKINLVTDALSGDPVGAGLHDARNPDQAIGFELPRACEQGDLLIRDRGYFSLDALAKIERREAFWISRLPASVTCFDGEGDCLDDILARTRVKRLDMDIWMGRNRAHRCRLIATRLPAKEAEKNRRQRHREAKRRRTTAAKRGLVQDGWSLVVTNIEDDRIDPDEIYKLYSIRWSIEIQFRAMKQSNRLQQSLHHRGDPFLIEALVMAVLIRQLLTIELQARLNESLPADRRVSIEKLSDAYSYYLLTRTLSNLNEPFRYDLRHVAHEKRKRQTLYATTVQSLA